MDPQQKSQGTLRKGSEKLRPQLGQEEGWREERGGAVRRQTGLENHHGQMCRGLAGGEGSVL